MGNVGSSVFKASVEDKIYLSVSANLILVILFFIQISCGSHMSPPTL